MSSALIKLRIIAIPLTRPTATRTLPHPKSNLNRLVYYQFQITVPKLSTPLASGDQENETASTDTKNNGWLPQEGIVKWTTNKAADIWAGFGKNKSGWKLKVFQAGERMVDRMEFEELALKSIDLSKSPSLPQFSSNPISENKKAPFNISLVFPPSFLPPSEVLLELRAYAEHRIPKHRKGFYFWMLIAPLTTPFIIVPIIPNLPFFFCVWRSWSHYRAYRSSQYLQSLLDHDLILPEASKPLDEVYKLYPPTAPSPPSNPDSVSESNPTPKMNLEREPEHELLLEPQAVPSIISLFELESTTTNVDLRRAIEQAHLRVATGRTL